LDPALAFPAAAALLIFPMFFMLVIMCSFLAVHDRPGTSGLGNKKAQCSQFLCRHSGIPACPLIEEAGKPKTAYNASDNNARSSADARTDGSANGSSQTGSAGGNGSGGCGLGGSFGKLGSGDFVPGVTHGIPGGFDGGGGNPDSVVSVFHGKFLLQK
jgi:hypothetical protein